MLRYLRQFWLISGVALLLATACGGGTPPTLVLTADKTEASPGGTVTLNVAATGFKFADPASGASTDPSVGFFRVYLDDKTGDDFLAEGFATPFNVTLPSDLSEGDHTLRVVLLKSDKTPFSPEVAQTVKVKVVQSVPTLSVTADKTKVKPGEQIMLTIKATGISLVPPAANTVNKTGQGHYHVSFDDDDPEQTYASLGHEETVRVTIPLSITAGAHKMHVYLMNNNHSKYTPEVKQTIDIEVTEAAPPTLQISLNKQTAAPGDTVFLSVSVTNFQLKKIEDNAVKKSGEGHYHVLIGDGDPTDSNDYIAADFREKLEVVLPNNTPLGKTKIFVYLMNNDHSKYAPETKASAELEIVGKDQPIVNMSVPSTDIVAGEDVEVSISVKNFNLTAISNNPTNKSGEGHYHIVLDDADPEKDYITADFKDKVTIKLPAATKPGAHKLRVILMNNDHTVYKPEAKTAIDINVIDPNAPRISFKVDKTSVKAGDKMQVTVEVKNFALKAISGTPTNKAGEGHFHLAFDDNDPEQTYITATHETDVTITIPSNLPKGKHKLVAYLMNNDHTKYSPEVKFSLEFEITE